MPQISLKDYASLISLQNEYKPSIQFISQCEEAIVKDPLCFLLNENEFDDLEDIPKDYSGNAV